MKILITGICGFVGSTLAQALLDAVPGLELVGIDNFIRPGAETNRAALKARGVRLFHGDLRAASDLDAIPTVDWVVDAAANPSVLAGIDGRSSSRQLIEHNLFGTVNLLEFCKAHRAGFILLSTSRVYSIAPLAALPVVVDHGAFRPDTEAELPPGLDPTGVRESFATAAPVSLYGATKLASEALALEYGETFGFPVWINRCGVLAGAGQFGRPDQGIFAYWINAHLRRRPLKFIGFDGQGHQVRDCLHPRDLVPLLLRQFARPDLGKQGEQTSVGGPPGVPPVRNLSPRICNVAGGADSSISLRQLTAWCDGRFGAHPVASEPQPRPFDIPWMVLDATQAATVWDWRPQTPLLTVLEEIAVHAQQNPGWLDLSSPF
ncbi:MAG: NAD-dependent epimerase/dehydratase family protein [Opitutaceae bacterium]|nr:NAD-dependent epimerase/dehydratase family protein [Opitutaceae bacterium]